jgi:hypothetical protein
LGKADVQLLAPVHHLDAYDDQVKQLGENDLSTLIAMNRRAAWLYARGGPDEALACRRGARAQPQPARQQTC